MLSGSLDFFCKKATKVRLAVNLLVLSFCRVQDLPFNSPEKGRGRPKQSWRRRGTKKAGEHWEDMGMKFN